MKQNIDKKRNEKPKTKRKFGVLKGKIKVAKDFDTPLPNDILDALSRERAAASDTKTQNNMI